MNQADVMAATVKHARLMPYRELHHGIVGPTHRVCVCVLHWVVVVLILAVCCYSFSLYIYAFL